MLVSRNSDVQFIFLHLQLGLVVLPRFVKRLLYVLQRHRKTRFSELQRGQFEDRVICGLGSALEAQKMTCSAHDSGPECQVSDHAPSCISNTKSSWPSYSPRARHKGTVYLCEIYSLKGENSSRLLQSVILCTLNHRHRSLEMDRDMLAMHALPNESWERRGEKREGRETVNLTPFTPFKSPFSSESRVKITLWLRLWSCERNQTGEILFQPGRETSIMCHNMMSSLQQHLICPNVLCNLRNNEINRNKWTTLSISLSGSSPCSAYPSFLPSPTLSHKIDNLQQQTGLIQELNLH